MIHWWSDRHEMTILCGSTIRKTYLFKTMTCNPKWQEIKKMLEKEQLPQDRLDMASRFFRAKVHDLKDLVLKNRSLVELQLIFMLNFRKKGSSICLYVNNNAKGL